MSNTQLLPRPWNIIQLKKGGLIHLETDSPDDKGTHIASFTAKREAEADYVYEACNSFDRLTTERVELINAVHSLMVMSEIHINCPDQHLAYTQAQKLIARLEAK